MPKNMESAIAMAGAVESTGAPSVRRETAFMPIKSDETPMRAEGPALMMSGVSSGSLLWGGASTVKARGRTVPMRRGDGEKDGSFGTSCTGIGPAVRDARASLVRGTAPSGRFRVREAGAFSEMRRG